MVVLALNRSPLASDPAVQAATRRGVNWLLSMQNRDGGWAAYDVDIDNQVLTQLPFADHNAMLDPSCADITARVIELLGTLGLRADHPVDRPRARLPVEHAGARGLLVRPLGRQLYLRDLAGLAGLESHRLSHGSSLRSSGPWNGSNRPSSPREPGAKPAGATMTRRLKGTGEPTPSQTAWATLGLIAAGRAFSPAVRSGIDYLIQTQLPDGSWDEPQFTGTGFPRVFYLRYHLYSVYFPLMAMARYQAAIESRLGQSSPALACRIPAQPLSLDF